MPHADAGRARLRRALSTPSGLSRTNAAKLSANASEVTPSAVGGSAAATGTSSAALAALPRSSRFWRSLRYQGVMFRVICRVFKTKKPLPETGSKL